MLVADALTAVLGPLTTVKIDAYDGSEFGDPNSEVTLRVRSPQALAYLVHSPNELGLARAYVTGEIEIDGDMYDTLNRLGALKIRKLSRWEQLTLIRRLGGLRLLRQPPIPTAEARVSGRRHSKDRDQQAIAHHYDVSNDFYEWLLGESMTYTCAVYPTTTASLEEAQYAKYDLVARKLDLKPGMRLLDVGCGWGGMTMHAAREYGAHALGVTLSRRQAEWAAKAIAKAGLSDLAEVRHLDYRDVKERDFDAISSIGLTEHIGERELSNYFRFLYDKLRPTGRLLNHCITRPNDQQKARAGKFISRYVFPDGELLGPAHIASVANDAGFEIRHSENLREHYAMTLAAWSANLERHWQQACDEVGTERARVWRLYLAASRLGFDRNNIQLHQLLLTKTTRAGEAAMPLRPTWLS